MNIDFQTDPGFSAYVLLLMFSGIAMLILASPTVKHSTLGLRALNALFGLGFLGYGFYLAFLFDGGGYFIFFKAFILPVLLIARTIRSARAARSQRPPAYAVTPNVPQQMSPSPAGPALPSAHPVAPASHAEQPTQP